MQNSYSSEQSRRLFSQHSFIHIYHTLGKLDSINFELGIWCVDSREISEVIPNTLTTTQSLKVIFDGILKYMAVIDWSQREPCFMHKISAVDWNKASQSYQLSIFIMHVQRVGSEVNHLRLWHFKDCFSFHFCDPCFPTYVGSHSVADTGGANRRWPNKHNVMYPDL